MDVGREMFLKESHQLKKLAPMCVTEFGMPIDLNFLQQVKAQPPMELTLFGIMIVVTSVSAKAHGGIVVTLFPILIVLTMVPQKTGNKPLLPIYVHLRALKFTVDKLLQNAKASSPIVSTEGGMVIEVSPLQL